MLKHLFFLVPCFALLAIGAYAQNTGGSISGTVHDPSGAVIAGATVVATNTATNVADTTRTNSAGAYSFPVLPVGTYTIQARQTGFKAYRQTGIVVNVNSALTVNATLQVGAVSQSVTVSASALHVQTSNATLGDVINSTKLLSQPLPTRSFVSLMGLQAGVNPSATASGGVSVSGNLNPGDISVNGSRPGSNNFTVNGGSVTEGEAGGTTIIPDLDSIAQFRIITNSGDAEYGRLNGGTVQVVTKSGTNQFHGDAFEFYRDASMDANTYFNNLHGVPLGAYRQDQFGGTIGGPILHNRLFFFGDYQGSRFTQAESATTIVPDSLQQQGNLSGIADELTGTVSSANWASVLSNQLGYGVSAGEPYYTSSCTNTSQCVFPGAIIPKSGWAGPAAHYLGLLPQPTPGVTIGGRAAYAATGFNGTANDNKASVRIDGNTYLGHMSGYYLIDNSTVTNPFGNGGGSLPGFPTDTPGRNQQFNFQDTSTFGTNKVNQLLLNFTRAYNLRNAPTGGLGTSFTSLGFVSGGNGLVPAIPALAGTPEVGTNNWDIGLGSGGRTFAENIYQLGDNFSIIRGNHQIKFGGEGIYTQLNERNRISMNGTFGFDGTETGSSLADFLIGAVDTYTQASYQLLNSRAGYMGYYLQDTWRTTPNLTLDYGLRWDISTFWWDTQNQIQAIEPGVSSQIFPGSPTGWVFPGDFGVPRTLAPTRYNNLAPRFGFAYSPTTSGPFSFLTGPAGHFAIRGAWGVFYTDVSDGTLFTELADAPFGLYWQVPSVEFATPWVAMNGQVYGQHFPFTPPPPGDTNINWAFFEPISSSPGVYTRNRIPYTEEYNLTIQRQFGGNTVVSVGYVGSQGHRLMAALEANPGIPSLCMELMDPANLAPGQQPCGPNGENNVYVTSPTGIFGGQTINGTRAPLGINFGAGDQWYIDNTNSTYNSLQVELRHTSARYQFLAAYTFAKTITNSSAHGGALDPFNYHATRSLASFDVPQNFVISYRVLMPFDRLDPGHLTRLLGGWWVSGTTTFASGEPIGRMSYGNDNSLIGTFGVDRPQFLGGSISHLNPRTSSHHDWIANPKSVFGPEPLGQVGNSPNYFIIGPGLNNTDLSLEKDIRTIGEDRVLQLRVDAFNVFNHAQFTNPSGNFSSGSFMAISNTRDARIMQLGVKFLF
jgi:hypothetical protein